MRPTPSQPPNRDRQNPRRLQVSPIKILGINFTIR
jgi:hypothetical protein